MAKNKLSITVKPTPSVVGKKSLGDVVTLRNHTSFVSFLGIHPNQKFLVSGGWDGRVNFWKSDFNDIQETLQPVFRIILVKTTSQTKQNKAKGNSQAAKNND